MNCIHEKCVGKLVPVGENYKCPVCSLQVTSQVLKKLRPEYFENGSKVVEVPAEQDPNDKFKGWDKQRPNFVGY